MRIKIIFAIISTIFVLILCSCSPKKEMSLRDWDLISVGYDSSWCKKLDNNSDFALGIIEINSEAYSDDLQNNMHHSDLIQKIVQRLAPQCKTRLIVLNTDATDSDISNAILQLYDEGFRVINMSFGRSQKINFNDNVRSYITSGTLVLVCASGNQDSGVLYPAADDLTVSVFAKDINGGIAKLNSEKDKAGFSAPGLHVWVENAYYSGSSIATAYVSTAFAALHAKYPEMHTAELIEIARKHTIDASMESDLGVIQLSGLLN